MDWKQEAVSRLKQYRAMETALTNICDEIKRLEDEAVLIQSGNLEMPVGGQNPKGPEDRLINNLVARQQLTRLLEQTGWWLKTTTRALEALDDMEKTVLEYFYISPQRGGVCKLCETLALEQSSVYRHRDKALHKFTLAMYGATQS